MSTQADLFRTSDIVGEIVAERPSLSRVFEQAGIDYCCGGKKSVEEACRKKGIDATAFLTTLEEAAVKDAEEPVVDALSLSQADLVHFIEWTHHAFLKSQLPRVGFLSEKVAAVHGGEDSRLVEVKQIFQAFARDLTEHMALEEEVIFPKIREGETGAALAEIIRKLESDHDRTGATLVRLRELTDDYTPPDWACNSYRALLDTLARIERDMHQHVHKENNILFPRAINGTAKIGKTA